LKNQILITGINGFLGEKIVESYGEYDFIGLDLNPKNIKQKVYNSDIRNYNQLEKINENIDYIIHLASITNSNNLDIFDVNVKGTKNICDLGKKLKIKKIIYLSTVSVYSGNTEKNISEDTIAIPSSNYGKSKFEAEEIIKKSGLNYTILRPTNIFSENDKKYSEYFLRALKKIILYRDRIIHLIYLDDIVDIIIKCLTEKKTDKEIYIVSDKEKEYKEKNVLTFLSKINNKNPFFLRIPDFFNKNDKRIFSEKKIMKIFKKYKFGIKYGLKKICL